MTQDKILATIRAAAESDGVNLNKAAREAAMAVDPSKVFNEARRRMINDMTNPVDIHEHVCRVAGEMAALNALRALEGE